MIPSIIEAKKQQDAKDTKASATLKSSSTDFSSVLTPENLERGNCDVFYAIIKYVPSRNNCRSYRLLESCYADLISEFWPAFSKIFYNLFNKRIAAACVYVYNGIALLGPKGNEEMRTLERKARLEQFRVPQIAKDKLTGNSNSFVDMTAKNSTTGIGDDTSSWDLDSHDDDPFGAHVDMRLSEVQNVRNIVQQKSLVLENICRSILEQDPVEPPFKQIPAAVEKLVP